MALTPMMKQYFEIKSQNADTILFFRLGDFYEMFDQDAVAAAEILGITLTSRAKGEGKIPMCGVPFHAASQYIAKLTRAGRKVAICEQTSDPSLPGIVKREVIRTITPGTTLDENVLDQGSSNYLVAIEKGDGYGIACADLSTGELIVSSHSTLREVSDHLMKLKPSEAVVAGALLADAEFSELRNHFPDLHIYKFESHRGPREVCENHFGLMELSRHQIQDETVVAAMGRVIEYLQATQKTSLQHLRDLKVQDTEMFMQLDESTIRNLELLENMREKKSDGSLFSVLNKTVTAAGSRLLRKVIVQPLVDAHEIHRRHEFVDFFVKHQSMLLDLRLTLKQVGDIERMLSKLALGSGNARDIRGLINSYRAVAELRALILEQDSPLFAELGEKIDCLEGLMQRLDRAIVEEPPLTTRDGGMIADGYNEELDSYRSISKDGKSFIQQLQAREIERTGISTLKVKYNKVFGYYIEVSNANLSQVPEDYVRKQTLTNAERFSTPELKEYESKVLGAEEKIIELETRLFEDCRLMIVDQITSIKRTAECLSFVDVMSTFAIVSWENSFVKPIMHEDYILHVVEGRHPVVEKLSNADRFVANDCKLTEDARCMLITGPNMGGKSTFLRQTALIVLMAHLGCFVPAKDAQIPFVDRIFTRVGASDNLVKGQSTFWVEMEEASLILSRATNRSLVILDEVGRGTSTFDGVSIAWGILEYLHNQIQAKTLFATHYHELIALAASLPHAQNFSVQVEEKDNDIVFLYKIVAGGVDRSYGIEVARLAGLPSTVIGRAKEILHDLENENIGSGQQAMDFEVPAPERNHVSLKHERVIELLKATDLNKLSPLEALNKFAEIKNTIDAQD